MGEAEKEAGGGGRGRMGRRGRERAVPQVGPSGEGRGAGIWL